MKSEPIAGASRIASNTRRSRLEPSARFVPSVTFECLPEVSPFIGRTKRQGLARASRTLSSQAVGRALHGLKVSPLRALRAITHGGIGSAA